MLLKTKKLTTKLSLVVSQTHSHFQVKSLEKQSAAHSIFSQVSDSRLIKMSRFLLFRLTFFIHHVPVHCPSLAKGPQHKVLVCDLMD